MILEQVILNAPETVGRKLHAAVTIHRPLIEGFKGVGGFELRRSVETPERYTLLTWWETLNDHLVEYRQSVEFAQVSAALKGLYQPPFFMEHYVHIIGNSGRILPSHLLETVTLTIENAGGFEAALPGIMKDRLGASGLSQCEFRRSLETPSRYVMFSYWTSLEAHTVDYRGSPNYPVFTGGIRPFLTPPAQVEHWMTI